MLVLKISTTESATEHIDRFLADYSAFLDKLDLNPNGSLINLLTSDEKEFLIKDFKNKLDWLFQKPVHISSIPYLEGIINLEANSAYKGIRLGF